MDAVDEPRVYLDLGDVFRSEVNYGAGERAGDPFDRLDLGDYEFPKIIDVRRAGTHDDVIRTGYILGRVDAFDVADFLSNLSGLADLGLDEDVSLYVRH